MKRSRRRPLPILAAAVLATAGLGTSPAPAAEGRVRLAGILTDQHVDLPLDPARADAPKPRTPPAPVRIAARDGSLPPVEAKVAPIEVVAAGGNADLVWDAATGDLAERDQVIAGRVAAEDLGAAADRVALVRRVRDLVLQAPRSIRITPEEPVLRAGQRLDLTVLAASGRTVVVFVVGGDGMITVVHPSKSDRTPADGDVTISLDAGPPFGRDQIVVLTAGRPIDDFVTSLRRLDRRRAAGEVLGLVDALGGGIDMATQTVSTRP